MNTLIENWNVGKEYHELDIVTYGNNTYMAVNKDSNTRDGKSIKVKAGTIPIGVRNISNGIGTVDNQEFVNKLLNEYRAQGVQANCDDSNWIRI